MSEVYQTFDRSHNLEEEFHFQQMRTKGNHPWETRTLHYVLSDVRGQVFGTDPYVNH